MVHHVVREQLAESLSKAVKEQDKRRTGMFRLINAAIKDRDIADRSEGRDVAGEDEILQILVKMIKQRKESVRSYDEAGQFDMAEREREEIAIIKELLPAQLNWGEMEQACRQVVEETDAKGLRDVGRCMNKLKARYPGQMDFGEASSVVKTLLK
ncbi:GatB/YqeY domain-containing protein [Consotaella aegiceratis]|uniref:GatB/YqeY domain-containing protein n=1 Tax=Consotaella aegiceratis TaxID=3097961 RepID=UPI002F42E155